MQAPIDEPAPADTRAMAAPSVKRPWTQVQPPTMAAPLPTKRPRAKSKQVALPPIIGASYELQRVFQQKADERARANRIATEQASQDLTAQANVEPIIIDLSQESAGDTSAWHGPIMPWHRRKQAAKASKSQSSCSCNNAYIHIDRA